MNAILIVAAAVFAQHGGNAAKPAESAAPDPRAEQARTLWDLEVLPGFAWDLFAKEPLVADPVAIAVDEEGRIFVAESERQEKGVEDNRHQSYWLIDDLSSATVEDRLRMYEKWAGKRENGMEHYTRWADRVRVLVDPDEEGKPTRAVNFSGDLREPLDGTGAGVLARNGEVWYTCIPTLWRFRDSDGDGAADERDRVFDGFGVRIALRGHDMHGLTFGPDGRLYWSIGDRGYHVTLPDGRVITDPRSGAVFRCEPDGSGFEVFCTGLRNPQELAFNRFGDLFTGDNNSDAGDKARIVWCVDGGETGWEMDYQTLEGANQRGPWNQERIWWLWDAEDRTRPAWTLPPLAHVSSGPSGLVAYPGVGFDERYDDAFFLCDFLGDDNSSRVLAFKAERDGAGYEISDVHPFVTDVLPTDVDFDYAGRMVISDWDATWESNGKGQIYRVWDPRFVDSPAVREVTSLMRGGFGELGDDELGRLLGHADMRVRLRAQWELAERVPRSLKVFAPIARGDREGSDAVGFFVDPVPLEARLHAIWGLGQIVRAERREAGAANEAFSSAAGDLLVLLLADEEPEIRTQAARVLGDAAYEPALEPLIGLATDEEPRVRLAAATALGRLGRGAAPAIPALVAILWENEDQNPYLRHAASLALARIGDREKLLELAADPFAQVRLGAVLALRRLRDPALARSLFDPDRRVATEAARAVHDLPIPEARPALVALAERWAASGDATAADASGTLAEAAGTQAEAASGDGASSPESSHGESATGEPNLDAVPLLRRAIDECLREGSGRAAEALLGIAANPEVPSSMRVEALESLRVFADPVARRASMTDGTLVPSVPPVMRDRVQGHVRPVDLASRDVEGYRRALSTRLPELASSGPDALRALARSIAEEQNVALDPAAALATLRDASAPARERAQCLAQLVRQGHPEIESLVALALESEAPPLRMAAREALSRLDARRAVAELRRSLAEDALAERQAALALLARLEREDADGVLVEALRAAAHRGPSEEGAGSTALDLDLLEAAQRRAAASAAVAQALVAWRGDAPTEGAALHLALALEGGDAERGREVVNFHSAAACLRCHALAGHGGDAAPALDGVGTRLSRLDLLRALVDPNAAIADGYTSPSAMPDMTTLLSPRDARDVVEFLSTLAR